MLVRKSKRSRLIVSVRNQLEARASGTSRSHADAAGRLLDAEAAGEAEPPAQQEQPLGELEGEAELVGRW